MLDHAVAEPLTTWGPDYSAVMPAFAPESRPAAAADLAGPGSSVPMGPFPARLRLGPVIDHLDIVVGEFDEAIGVEEAWEHSATMLGESLGVHVRRPGLWCGDTQPTAVMITFGLPSGASSIEFGSTMSIGVLYATAMSQALADELTEEWRAALNSFGLLAGPGARDPRWMLRSDHTAAWPDRIESALHRW